MYEGNDNMSKAKDVFCKVSRTIHDWQRRNPNPIRFRPVEIYHHRWYSQVGIPACSVGKCIVGLKMNRDDGNSIVYKNNETQPMFIVNQQTKQVTAHGEIEPMYYALYEDIVNVLEGKEMNKSVEVARQPKTFLEQVRECLEKWWCDSGWFYYKTHESMRHLKFQFGDKPIDMLGILENTSGGITVYTENDIMKVVLEVKEGGAFPSLYTNSQFTNGWAITAAYMINKKLFPRLVQGRLATDEEIDELRVIMNEFKTLAMKQNTTSTTKLLTISDNVESIKSANTIIPTIKQVHFNRVKGYTTVLFNDGTKTITKGPSGDEFDPEIGYSMCIMKRMHVNRTQFKKVIDGYMKKSEFRNTKIQKKVDRKAKQVNGDIDE